MLNRRKFRKVFVWILLVSLVIIAVVASWQYQKKSTDEISTILANSDREVRRGAYLRLIKRVGPENAQTLLYKSGLPYDGEAHFLNHTVGEYLYENFGYGGLDKCLEYFSASCYHGFLIDFIAENQIRDVSKILQHCKNRGEGVFLQCSHGIGHGYLALLGYDNLTAALEKCDEIATFTNIDANACYGGVFMENTWGLHDGETKGQWIKKDDPHYPCNDSRISPKHLASCWDEQPTLIYKYITENMDQIIEVCNQLTDRDFQFRCFRGIARLMNPMTQGSLVKKIELCRMLPEKWVDMCFGLNAGTSYGQGDRNEVFKICDYVVYGQNRQSCLTGLVQSIHVYAVNKEDEMNSCKMINDKTLSEKCVNEIQ